MKFYISPYDEEAWNAVMESAENGIMKKVVVRGVEFTKVVRCKDCYWRGEDEYCDKHGFYVCGDEFFCASGRKEQNDG